MNLMREGDFIESIEGAIFDVKGVIQPPDRTIAFIRYFPSPDGERVRDGVRYRKVYSLSARYRILEEIYPQYLHYDTVFNEHLSEVPVGKVKVHHDPTRKLEELLGRAEDEAEKDTADFAGLLMRSTGLKIGEIGASGSVLVGLQSSSSDIDIVVYGESPGRRLHNVLGELMSDAASPVKAYTVEGLIGLYRFRSKDTRVPLSDFRRTEERKRLQGTFRGRDFFIRLVKERHETQGRYGDTIYYPAGRVKIKAKVVSSSDSIYTPCRYDLMDVTILSGPKVEPLTRVESFRGRFCEQAMDGETILAEGKAEKVEHGAKCYYRLLLGSETGDYMILESKTG